MVAGIVVFAVGAKRTLEVTGELPTVPATALCAGVALYLVALSAFKRRNVGSWNQPRLVAAAALVALTPLATTIPALLALALVVLIAGRMIAYEVTAYSEARERIRHAA
jgi:low temperature requirement protein LtrA